MFNSKLNEKRDKKKKIEFKGDMKKYIDEFREFKDKSTWKKVENYIQLIKLKFKHF